MMKKIIFKAETRGHANHGWLDAHHTFSFAGYHDPSRVHFGMLRVLNDDVIAEGRGFGAHPHDNMEIITIPLSGAIQHNDNTGNASVIRSGDVQIMSAGTGIVHAEANASAAEKLSLFQIWIFPKEENIKPRYDQRTYLPENRKNKFEVVVSPEESENSLWINQDAWLSLGDFENGKKVDYQTHLKGNGVFIQVIEGSVEVSGETLNKRDAIGISEEENISLSFSTDARILIIEVPME